MHVRVSACLCVWNGGETVVGCNGLTRRCERSDHLESDCDHRRPRDATIVGANVLHGSSFFRRRFYIWVGVFFFYNSLSFQNLSALQQPYEFLAQQRGSTLAAMHQQNLAGRDGFCIECEKALLRQKALCEQRWQNADGQPLLHKRDNTTEIAKTLNYGNVLHIHWQRGRIEYILRNERYIGDAQLQKKYTTDVFPRKRMRNNGERNSYYITGNHDAIIPQDWFERVQRLLKSRGKTVSAEKTPFHGRIQCSCGAACRSKRSTSARYWLCMRHDSDEDACPITQIPEVQIQEAFLRLYYNLKHQGSHILPDLIVNLQSIRERKFLWSVDVIELNKQIAELTSQNQLLATLRESGCVDPDIFISKSNALTERLCAAKQAKSRILNQDGDDTIPCTQELITILKRGPETLHDFDGELFGQLIDKVIIESNTSLRFRLKNGLELRESIERTVR